MQHPEEGGAGYPYGPPLTGMAPFSPQPASATVSVCNNIPSPSPSPMHPQPQTAGANLEQLPGSGGGGGVSFHDDDDMPVDGGSGRSAGDAGAGGSGSRWPREETVALIRIRSEMDGAFRNAALKAPVWEEVSRKLAELGYRRSAKKCKEKFENVDKYYRRTKEGRAGRQDGKNYRFFEELEALHAAAPQQNQPMLTATAILSDPRPLAMAPAHPAAGLPDLSLSSNSESESESESESDDESDEEEDQAGGGGGRSNESMMGLFEGMIKQITEKQDATQRLFLETLEKWEADRTAREEAWRRQELARISREREQHARERAAAAARDAALIAFLQRVGGNSVLPTQMPAPHPDAPAASLQLVVAASEEGGRRESSASMSRWPKEEVHALIQLRMEKDEHCQDMGAKGPLWEDISAGMRRIGYNRSSKRCKEKWENINKYFKKVKESNKRRPEDSKTCPYFHQLDAIYRKKQFAVTKAGGGCSGAASGNTLAAVNASASATEKENPWRELEGKISNDIDRRYSVGGGSSHAPPGDAEMAAASTVLDAVATNKKSEDKVMAMGPSMQSQQKELTATDETDSDDIEGNYTDDGDDDDDGNEDDKMKYTIEFQKHKESGSSSAPAPATAATVVTSSAPTSSTFLTVQ